MKKSLEERLLENHVLSKHFDLELVDIPDEDIDFSDIPEKGPEWFENATYVVFGSEEDTLGRFPKPDKS